MENSGLDGLSLEAKTKNSSLSFFRLWKTILLRIAGKHQIAEILGMKTNPSYLFQERLFDWLTVAGNLVCLKTV